jgi:Flp pilus assembly pilin Flp
VGGEFQALRDRLRRQSRRAALFEYALLIGIVTLTVLAVIIAVGWPNGMWANIVSGKAI